MRLATAVGLLLVGIVLGTVIGRDYERWQELERWWRIPGRTKA